MTNEFTAVGVSDIFVVTDTGRDELKYGSTRLPLVALELLVLFDGKKSLAHVMDGIKGHPTEELLQMAQFLAREGYVEYPQAEPEILIDMSLFLGGGAQSATAVDPLPQDNAEAEKAEHRLSLDGYYVGIARRAQTKKRPNAASNYASQDDWIYTVLVVEDNKDIQRTLKLLLSLEKFEPRVAGNRNEIVTELRRVPSPDVILMDVNLPDANGFDILAKIRQHPVLKGIPVLMLTSQANREDVLRGMAGGADGYITKPFENEILIRSIRTVLGF